MINKKDEKLEIDKKMGIIGITIIVLLIVGGQIIFLIALSRL